MGTNFYIMTKSKRARNAFFGYNYELTDTPYWGYMQHIAKTSAGWLPLFDGSGRFKSIKDIRSVYSSEVFVIVDEYGKTYTWEQFDERVLKFNGGTINKRVVTQVERDPTSIFYDSNMPNHIPVSHFEYANGAFNDDYFMDDDGYEFSKTAFE